MRNIKLVIEYDGTAYHGWQSQINAKAVQDVVEGAIRKLTGEDCRVTGSSRTDAGVHALGFACNFFTKSKIPADKFAFALNTLLPDDVVARSSEEVPPDFHARFSAKGKKYSYLIYNSVFPSALLRHRAYHVFYPLDVNAMKEAAAHFTGTHDFLAFSATGGSSATTVRTVVHASVGIAGTISSKKYETAGYDGASAEGGIPEAGSAASGHVPGAKGGKFLRDSLAESSRQGYVPGKSDSVQDYAFPGDNNMREAVSAAGWILPVNAHERHVADAAAAAGWANCPGGRLVEFSVEGDGFLYNMVRIMAGTLIEVGIGRIKPADIPEIIAGRDRRKAGRTAPAHGLYLVEVYYG